MNKLCEQFREINFFYKPILAFKTNLDVSESFGFPNKESFHGAPSESLKDFTTSIYRNNKPQREGGRIL